LDHSLTPGHSTSKNADDIVITLAVRTPLTKARKGGFKDTSLEYLIYALLKEVRERSNLDPALVEDICLGNVRRRRYPCPHLLISPSR
jgi:acetyl-CoA acyltransferase 1